MNRTMAIVRPKSKYSFRERKQCATDITTTSFTSHTTMSLCLVVLQLLLSTTSVHSYHSSTAIIDHFISYQATSTLRMHNNIVNNKNRHGFFTHHLCSKSEGGDSYYSPSEINEMEELVLSLSFEKDDQCRRQRVLDIFTEQLAKPNGFPQRFTTLFDKILIQVGDQARADAIEKITNQQQPTIYEMKKDINTDDPMQSASKLVDNKNRTSISTIDDDVTIEPREKTLEELQVWALIDMMVQSKTIVKKANGRLGSQGTFG